MFISEGAGSVGLIADHQKMHDSLYFSLSFVSVSDMSESTVDHG